MQTVHTVFAGRRGSAAIVVRAAFVAGAALLVCACNTDQQVAGIPSVPNDYRMRHPITIREADRTFALFIGTSRGALTPVQRAELLAFAQSWRRDATGGVLIDMPVGSSNEHATADALPEIRSILAATGLPPQSIVVRGYHPPERDIAAIRISYPKIIAQAGPCGLWPEDIGPSYNRDYFENRPYWNLGCASQRDLAAMVDNPQDLVQPRAEAPAYAMRRTTVVEKYRQGVNPSGEYPASNSAKISDLGK